MNPEASRVRRIGLATALSSALGAALVAIAGQLSGADPAGHLAAQLGLPNGIALAAMLGGLVGLWLSAGSLDRAAKWAGWIGAILLGTLLWSFGRPLVWILDVFLEGVFGPPANGLGPFLGIGVLLALVRAAGGSLASRAEAWVERRQTGEAAPTKARPAPVGQEADVTNR